MKIRIKDTSCVMGTSRLMHIGTNNEHPNQAEQTGEKEEKKLVHLASKPYWLLKTRRLF